jgi:hypothetical protein
MDTLDQPDTETMSSKALEIYWKEKSVQLSCEATGLFSSPASVCVQYVTFHEEKMFPGREGKLMTEHMNHKRSTS